MNDNWNFVPIQNTANIVTGNTPKKKDRTNYGNDVPFVKPTQLQNTYVQNPKEYLSYKGAENARLLTTGSSLVTCIGELGRVGYVKEEKVAFNQQINGVDFDNEIVDDKFGFYYLQSPKVKNYLEKVSSATTVPIVNKTKFSKMPIPVPSLPTQKRIVLKIEELFSQLDAGVKDLNKIKKQLEQYRQSVLKAAFEGKLTGGKDWKEVKIEDVARIVSGKTPKGLKNYHGHGEIDYYKVSDMNTSGNEKYMKNANIMLDEDFAEELKMKICFQGTVIFPKRGGAILTNKKRILSKRSCYDLNTMGLVPDAKKILSEFLYYFLISLDLAKLCDGSAVPQINNKDIYPLLISLPKLKAQQQIVQIIEEQFFIIDHLEKVVEESLEKAESLRQSILKKAFEGRLV